MPSTDHPVSAFLRWSGDVPAGHETDNPLEVVVDRPLAITPLFEVTPDTIYVDSATGSDANDGTTAEAPFKTLDKAFATTRLSHDVAATDAAGLCQGESIVRLAPAATPYKLKNQEFVAGKVLLDGGSEATPVSIENFLDVGYSHRDYPTSPFNGALRLHNVDWLFQGNNGSRSLRIGTNWQIDRDVPVQGSLTTEGGSFSIVRGNELWIGGFNDERSNGSATGKLVFGADTTPIDIEVNNLRCGNQYIPRGPVEGLFDASATTGGRLRAKYITCGYGGAPGKGQVLLGKDWEVLMDEAASDLRIGNNANNGSDCSSRGPLSFDEGGTFSLLFKSFHLGHSESGRGVDSSGSLTGKKMKRVEIHGSDAAYIGVGTTHGIGYGTFDFLDTDNGIFETRGSFYGAQNGHAISRFVVGEDWRFRIGEPTVPAYRFGFGIEAKEGGDGFFSMKSGLFETYVKEFRLGYNAENTKALIDVGRSDVIVRTPVATIGTDGLSSLHATFDASASTNVVFDAKNLQVGYGTTFCPLYGHLALGQGEGTVTELYLGLQNADPKLGVIGGRLDLHGFRMRLEKSAEIRRSGQIRVTADGRNAGLDLATAAKINVSNKRTDLSGPAIVVTFRSLPENYKPVPLGSHDRLFWGFRWDGDHVADLNALIEEEKLSIEATDLADAASAISVFHDPATDATYLGCPVSYKEETTLTVRASASDDPYEGTFVPPLGVLTGLKAGQEVVCSASRASYQGNRFRPVGYVLEEKNGETWGAPVTNRGPVSFTYVHGAQAGRLTWLWEDAAYQCVFPTEGGSGEIRLSPEPGANGYYEAGQLVTLTAVPSATQPRTRFVRWTGDVPAGMETQNPITVEIDRALTISPVFETIPEEFYVDLDNGLDDNAGTEEAPFKTVSKGLDRP